MALTMMHPNVFLLPAYYTLPREAVGSTGEFSNIPRNPREALTNPEGLEKITSKRFLLFMDDMVANMVWPFIGRRGWIEAYSGYSPAYIYAHMLNHWNNILHTVYKGTIDLPTLVAKNEYIEWCSMEDSLEIWMNCAELADEHFPYMRKVLEIELEFPCFEDFDLESKRTRRSRAYIDFLRMWTHAQTKHPMILTDKIPHRAATWTDSVDYRMDWESFLKTLEPAEREIISLRLAGKTQKEIAEIMGYKTHSAVQKKLAKIREKYEQWFSIDDPLLP